MNDSESMIPAFIPIKMCSKAFPNVKYLKMWRQVKTGFKLS